MKNPASFAMIITAMCVFTLSNYLITVYAPNKAIAQAAFEQLDKKEEYPKRQDQVLYAEVLNKVNSCSKVLDKEDNEFYTCPDGSTVSMVKWTRGTDRKGVVTKYYNKEGTNLLVYGHPDDVY